MPTKVPGAEDFVPDTRDVSILADAVQACRGCELYRDATQGVFGQGSADATVMFVGEQPGDREDRAGEPFVGPAGRLLDKALVSAGIDRDGSTSPTPSNTSNSHCPNAASAVSTRPQPYRGRGVPAVVARRVDAVRPEVVVLLGATAAKALLGNDFRLTAHRGKCWPCRLSPSRPIWTSTRQWWRRRIRHRCCGDRPRIDSRRSTHSSRIYASSPG